MVREWFTCIQSFKNMYKKLIKYIYKVKKHYYFEVRLVPRNCDSSARSVSASFGGAFRKLKWLPHPKILTYLALGEPQGISNFKKLPSCKQLGPSPLAKQFKHLLYFPHPTLSSLTASVWSQIFSILKSELVWSLSGQKSRGKEREKHGRGH